MSTQIVLHKKLLKQFVRSAFFKQISANSRRELNTQSKIVASFVRMDEAFRERERERGRGKILGTSGK